MRLAERNHHVLSLLSMAGSVKSKETLSIAFPCFGDEEAVL